LNTFEGLPSIGEDINLKTYMHVREDGIQLFAFSEEKERHIFMALITVSGIGPKLAQTILSGILIEELLKAIQESDLVKLTNISGVGKKTAQRMVIELKEKFTNLGLLADVEDKDLPSHLLSPMEEEALVAMISLGYKRRSVQDVLAKIRQNGKSENVEELIKKALTEISG
jgi:Holliday junction DNA helicase RuvA